MSDSPLLGCIVTFHPRHYAAITAGSKRTTVRWSENTQVGPATFIFEPLHHAPLHGEVLDSRTYNTLNIKPDDVHEPPATNMADYMSTLRDNYYPDMPEETYLQVVTFRLMTAR